MERAWKEAVLSEKDCAILEEIGENTRNGRWPQEMMELYHAGREEMLTLETSVGPVDVYVYWPEVADEKLPLVVNIHGGGFVTGRRDSDVVFSRNLCSRAEVIVADVDYTVAPGMRFPGQVYQCYDVIAHFGCNAESYGADASRIAVAGHSAGGTLAAAAVVLGIRDGGFVPVLQILDYPGLDMVTPVEKKPNGVDNPVLPLDIMNLYTRMYAEPEDLTDILCSPGMAPDEILCQMPPTVMLCCHSDVFRDEDLDFAHRLMSLGVSVLGRCFQSSHHGFTVQRWDEYTQAEDMILSVLEQLKK